MRGALSKAGRYYAGKVLTGNDDPVQYSCQQNFTILTTDGYWNTTDETSTYVAKREDNVTDVGDQDGVTGTARPFLDSGKYPNTLADIAMYYYKTDLRPTGSLGGLNDDGVRIDVSKNNVPSTAQDTADLQHMTTFTLGLGVSGDLAYSENYLSGGSADYNAILQGTKNWPNPLTVAAVDQRYGDRTHRRPVACRGQWPRPVPERRQSGRARERVAEDAGIDLGDQRIGGCGRHQQPRAGRRRQLRLRRAVHDGAAGTATCRLATST